MAIFFVILCFWHSYPLSWSLRKGLELICAAQGFTFQAKEVRASIGGSLLIEEAHIQAAGGVISATSLDVARIEWKWSDLKTLFSASSRLGRELSLSGVAGVWDAREPIRQPPTSRNAKSSEKKFNASAWLRWMPLAISLQADSVEILTEGKRWAARDIVANFSESETGRLEIGGILIQAEKFSKFLPSIHAITAWKKGTLWFASAELLPGLTIENFSIDLLQPHGPALSLLAAVFGGSLRGDLIFGSADGSTTWDIAAWATNISVDSLPPLLEVEGRAAGRLVEGRFTFRGQPKRLTDAEASLRLVASDFRWNDRGWESLEVAGSLIHRQLVVTSFDLRQKENHVNFNGEVSLAEDWSQMASSPFLLNVKAEIKELGALAGLLGKPLEEAAGRMGAIGTIKGRQGQLDGFLNMEASGIEFRSLPINSIRIETVFRQNEFQIVRCEAYSNKDALQATASIGLEAPHHYAAEINANIANLARYLVPFRAPAANDIYAGSMWVRWQGDGSAKAHSGAFELHLNNFASGLTPAGLTGKFIGTYSPQNLYFSTFQIENGPLQFESRATIASSGITLKDTELRNGNSKILDGDASFPINIFSVLSGTDWRAAIIPDRDIYVRAVTQRDLDLQNLMRLAGQKLPLRGQLRLNLEAGGPCTHLHAQGELAVQGMAFDHSSTPESSLKAQFSIKEGIALFDGTLQTQGFSPLTLKARLPFALTKINSEDWRWINPQEKFEANLDFPRADLSMFQGFFPALHLTGEASGSLSLDETIAQPKATGRIEFKNCEFDVSNRMSRVRKAEATITLDSTYANIDHVAGEIENGRVEIKGGINFSTFSNPEWNIRLRGDKIPFENDPKVRLQANVDIDAFGNFDAGKIDGHVRLVDGHISHKIEIIPRLVSLPDEESRFMIPPIEPSNIPNPFAQWALNVKIENETPLLFQNAFVVGEIIPNLTMTGTLVKPIPVGRITLKEMQFFLPFTILTIPDGRLDFFPDEPWIPMLDVRGTFKTFGFELQAYAFGRLNERKLILRSEPPLPQEALLMFLTTGIVPWHILDADLTTGTNNKSGSLLLQAGENPFNLPGISTNLKSLQARATPAFILNNPAALRDKTHLWENPNLAERDGFQLYNFGVSYEYRFR